MVSEGKTRGPDMVPEFCSSSAPPLSYAAAATVVAIHSTEDPLFVVAEGVGGGRRRGRRGSGERERERDPSHEARKSKFDHYTGKVNCLCCGKSFGSYQALEAHLVAKHSGWNSPQAKHLLLLQNGDGGSANDQNKIVAGRERQHQHHQHHQQQQAKRRNNYNKPQPETISLTHFMAQASKNSSKNKNKTALAAASSSSSKGKGKKQNLQSSLTLLTTTSMTKTVKSNVHVKGKMVLNSNTASGDQFVVRRSKERVTGKKAKVSSVKLGVLQERSKRLAELVSAKKMAIESELRALRGDTVDDDLMCHFSMGQVPHTSQEYSRNSKCKTEEEAERESFDGNDEQTDSHPAATAAVEQKEDSSSHSNQEVICKLESQLKECEELLEKANRSSHPIEENRTIMMMIDGPVEIEAETVGSEGEEEQEQDEKFQDIEVGTEKQQQQHLPTKCEICKIECPNHSAYLQHCTGKLHRAKELSFLKTAAGKKELGKLNSSNPPLTGTLGPKLQELVLGDLVVPLETKSAGAGEEEQVEVDGGEGGGGGKPPLCVASSALDRSDHSEMQSTARRRSDVQLSISKDLNKCVSELLQRLLFLQKRAFKENPIKNKARKRALFGLNEVKKSVKLGKCKALVVVPNIELTVSELEEKTRAILTMCREKGVEVVFALTRAKLGSFVKRGVRMSMCSVVDYSGCENEFKQMLQLKGNLIKQQHQQEEKAEERSEHQGSSLSLNAFAPSFTPTT